jgi:hypothetical protein
MEGTVAAPVMSMVADRQASASGTRLNEKMKKMQARMKFIKGQQ